MSYGSGTFIGGMARKCHRQEAATILFSFVSSSGGGLPGRPGLERVPDARYFWVLFRRLAAVSSHEFSMRQYVAVHRCFEFFFAGIGFELKPGVEGK